MDTTVKNVAAAPAAQRAPEVQTPPATAVVKTAAPEKVDTPRAAPAADGVPKAAIKQSAPNSALTTYKDHDSGRLIVRVYDRVSGDILVEFPPEKAFRSVEDVLIGAGMRPKKSVFV